MDRRALTAALRRDFERSHRSTNALRIMVFHRLGHAVLRQPPSFGRSVALAVLRRLQKWLVLIPLGIDLPFEATIGPGLRLNHLQGIVLGGDVVVGADCTLFHQVTLGLNEHSRAGESGPRLGDRVYVGAGAKIIGPVRVGDDAVVGANAVVVRDVPPGARVVSRSETIPARAPAH